MVFQKGKLPCLCTNYKPAASLVRAENAKRDKEDGSFHPPKLHRGSECVITEATDSGSDGFGVHPMISPGRT